VKITVRSLTERIDQNYKKYFVGAQTNHLFKNAMSGESTLVSGSPSKTSEMPTLPDFIGRLLNLQFIISYRFCLCPEIMFIQELLFYVSKQKYC